MTLATATNEATQLEGESIKYSVDFSRLLAEGETISSLSDCDFVGPNDDATISEDAKGDSTHVVFRFSDATANLSYRIRSTIETSLGNTRQGDVIINVI